MTAVLYGIKNCDTVKKARAWLDQHHVEYRFHDFRGDGLELKQVQNWLHELSLDDLINKRGTTWKQLDEKTRNGLTASNAAALIVVHPTLIKRPLLDIGHQRFVGFSDAMYRDIFKTHTL
ncbi:MAG TPA: ArsC family reductase [Spongiibacteraceae bacterium]|nr:ArsC family reductase [Spongiibacteraceae bacterium]